MTIEATYFYTDTLGRPVFRKVRRSPKKFKMQAAKYANDRVYWKGEPGCLERWQPAWVDKAMYRLPELLDALKHHEPIFFVEGERDADVLAGLKKVCTTTNWQGASAFTDAQAEHFLQARSRSIINIIRDNDDAGVHAAWERYSRLIGVGVGRERLRLYRPTDPACKDIADAALHGLRRNALTFERPAAVKEAAFRVNVEKVARYATQSEAS